MAIHNTREAELKLDAYRAATTACSALKNYSSMSSMVSRDGPTAHEIKTEAERLWKWMSTDDTPKET